MISGESPVELSDRLLHFKIVDKLIHAIEVNARPEVKSVRAHLEPPWARNAQELFYVSLTGALMRVGVERGPAWAATTPSVLLKEGYFTNAAGLFGRSYDIAPDGQRFLMINPAASTQTGAAPGIVVVLNWFEELKARVPVQ